MTPEERAEETLEDFFSLPGHGMKHFDRGGFLRILGPMIAKSITAAVAEEREACAQIAAQELEARRDCLKAADERKDQQSYSGHWFAITAAETIEKEIRARK